jgi:hypothetical protein
LPAQVVGDGASKLAVLDCGLAELLHPHLPLVCRPCLQKKRAG